MKIILLIISLGFFLRVYGLNWDQGFHLHPDERAITMFSLPLQFPSSFSEFLSPKSPLNPHFFAYGSLPLYLLKGTASLASVFNAQAVSYDQINLIGRFISVLFDMGTLLVIFFLGKKLFSKQIGLLGAFFYAISVFPIQAAHFYAVDTPLTFFILLTLYLLILFYEKPAKKKALFVGILFGASLATKTSALVLLTSIGIAIVIDFLLIFLKQPHRPHVWFPHLPKFFKRLLFDGVIITIITLITFIVFEPYALIDFSEFLRQTLQQSQMTYDAFTFPYTLQYVGKIPYWYELKNIFLWGQGPILATLSFLGLFYVIYKTIKQSNNRTIIPLTFFLIYFAVVGKFAVGFMRYMLPLYPLLCLFGAVFAYKLLMVLKEKVPYWKLVVLVCIGSILVWPLSFMNIYTQPNTRVLASEWIYENIPAGKTIAREHWDDGLPIGSSVPYNIQELPIYDMGIPMIKDRIYQTINQTDYIIIASNRLYVPLKRIAKNCQTWHITQERCPKNANEYYKKLFNGSLGFKKVAEFTSYPKLSFPLVKWEHEINDQAADESFTVYDHPKIMIFENEK